MNITELERQFKLNLRIQAIVQSRISEPHQLPTFEQVTSPNIRTRHPRAIIPIGYDEHAYYPKLVRIAWKQLRNAYPTIPHLRPDDIIEHELEHMEEYCRLMRNENREENIPKCEVGLIFHRCNDKGITYAGYFKPNARIRRVEAIQIATAPRDLSASDIELYSRLMLQAANEY